MRQMIELIRRKGLDREGFRYIIVGGLTTLVNYGLFVLLCSIMRIEAIHGSMTSITDTILFAERTSASTRILVANLISISASILFAYFANKLFVFRWRCHTRTELALEFVKFVGSRLVTMAIEIGAVLLFTEALFLNVFLGKAVSQVLVIILNYFISKLIVFHRAKL